MMQVRGRQSAGFRCFGWRFFLSLFVFDVEVLMSSLLLERWRCAGGETQSVLFTILSAF